MLCTCVISSTSFGQKIKYLSFDVKVGGGASIAYVRIDDLILPSQVGTPQTSTLHSYIFGYHIPVSANLIQFGNKMTAERALIALNFYYTLWALLPDSV